MIGGLSSLLVAQSANETDSVPDTAFQTPSGLFPLVSQTELWDALIGEKRELWKRRAAESLEADFPAWSEELYLEYSRNGVRTHFQDQRVVRNRRLYRLFLGVVATGAEGPWIPELESVIRSLAEEPSWVYPAHDGELRAYRGEYVQIDLGVAQRAFDLALMVDLLHDRLSPELIELVTEKINTRVLDPYLKMVRTGEIPPYHSWMRSTNNWNAVCHFGVIGSALILECDPARREEFVEGMRRYLPYYLSGFTDDGYCSEGLSYWNFGFMHFTALAELLRRATDGEIDLLNAPKMEAISLYPYRLGMAEGTYPIFADAALSSAPVPALLAYLGLRFEALRPLVDSPWEVIADGGHLDLVCFGFSRRAPKIEVESDVLLDPARSVFAEGGVVVSRAFKEGIRTSVALKAGHNGEHHNHNDVGSVVIAVDGVPLVIDPGKEVYSARTFGPKRYESRALNSFGHSVPVVAGTLQMPGVAHRGSILETDFTPASDTIRIEMKNAYEVPSLIRLERTIAHFREGAGRVEWSDRVVFEEPQDFTEALITLGTFTRLDESSGIIADQGKMLKVAWTSTAGPLEVSTEVVDAPYPDGLKPLRIAFSAVEPVGEAVIHFSFSPFDSLEVEVVREVDTEEKLVALTFDDGPDELSLRIVELLAEFDAKGTFFVVGDRLEDPRNAEILKAIVAAGHEIGNHTYTHPHLLQLDREAVEGQISSTQKLITSTTGTTPVLFRPPYLEYDDDVLRVLARLDLTAVLANRSTQDWNDETPPELLIERAARQVTPGSVVLMHSWSEKTYRALPEILRLLRERGYRMVTVSELRARAS